MRAVTTLILLLGMSVLAVPQKNKDADVPADIQSAMQAAQNARNELANAGSNWGGHRVKAIQHIDQAIAEIRLAEQYARSQHIMK